MEKTLKIINDEGMHARPAGIFVKKASEFKSSVNVKTASASKNGKSIMSLMSLGIKGGDSITIEAVGEDAEAALAALTDLIENKFHL